MTREAERSGMAPGRLAILAVVAAAALGAAPVASPSPPPAPLAGPDIIAFAAADTGAAHLWLMDVGTGARQRLTAGRYADEFPSWAPDGRRLVFSATRRVRVPGLSAPQITPLMAVMTLRTRAVRTITAGRAFDESPAWSPDGRRIALSRTPLPGGSVTTYPSVWTMDPAGHRLRRLTRGSLGDLAPAWSPDGRLVAFGRARSRSSDSIDLWVVRADGRGLRLLARDASHPAWSPDGTRIAFGRPKRPAANGCCGRDLYVMSARGTGRRLLARDAGQPSWSPDGARIAYTSTAGRLPQVWVTDADGAHRRRLTHARGGAYGPAWRPR